MSVTRYKILTGEHAGKIVEGYGCNARPFVPCPDSMIDVSKYGDGVWFPSLNLRLKQEYDYASGRTGCGKYVNYENLVVPFDKYGKEIFVGDKLYIASSKEVKLVEVVKFGSEYHVGCGWMQRKLTVKDLDTNKTLTINVPAHTIKVV
jgi:hypothetical protein